MFLRLSAATQCQMTRVAQVHARYGRLSDALVHVSKPTPGPSQASLTLPWARTAAPPIHNQQPVPASITLARA